MSLRNILMKDKKKREKIYFPTGATLLDLNAGGGKGMGLVSGSFINIIGDSGGGKSLVCTEIEAACHYHFGSKLLKRMDDSENGNTFDTEDLYGYERTEEESLKSDTTQEFDANLGIFLDEIEEDQVGLYIMDSLDGLASNEKMKNAQRRQALLKKGEEIVDEGSYGTEKAKFLSQDLLPCRVSQVEKKDALVVVVSQTREPINGTMFTKKVRNGGKALKFYCHQEWWVSTIRKLMKNGRQYGAIVMVKTGKQRSGRPGRSVFLTLLFDHGVDNIGSNLDFLFDLRSEKDGSILSCAEKILWDVGASEGKVLPWTSSNVKNFLKENDLVKAVQAAREKAEGKPNISMNFTKEWLQEDKKRKELYQKVFGRSETKEELLKRIEEDPKMEKELEKRVIDKWEALEASILSGRKRKYS